MKCFYGFIFVMGLIAKFVLILFLLVRLQYIDSRFRMLVLFVGKVDARLPDNNQRIHLTLHKQSFVCNIFVLLISSIVAVICVMNVRTYRMFNERARAAYYIRIRI